MTNNNDFSNHLYTNIFKTNMVITDEITRDIDALSTTRNNKLIDNMFRLGLEDTRSLSEKWDVFVTAHGTLDSNPDELYAQFILELHSQHICNAGKPVYSGYDSDFDDRNRVMYPNLPPLAPPSKDKRTEYKPNDNCFLPPINPYDGMVDMISKAVKDVDIGADLKLVKKTRPRRNTFTYNRYRAGSYGE